MIILNFNNISHRIGYLDDSYKCSPVWHRIDLNTIWYVFCLRIYLAVFILFSYSNALIAFFCLNVSKTSTPVSLDFQRQTRYSSLVYFGMSLHINSKNKKPLKKPPRNKQTGNVYSNFCVLSQGYWNDPYL